MKGILGLLRHKLPPEAARESAESTFFTTAFADHGISPDHTLPWEARAAEIDAPQDQCGKGGGEAA